MSEAPYDEATMAEIAKYETVTEEKQKECAGKLSHKADGVGGLKPFNQCMPKIVRQEKHKFKSYCVSWAGAASGDQAPFAMTSQSGFILVKDAKTMAIVKKPCKEPFVLECAITPDLHYIVSGGMQNAIKIYDTVKGADQPLSPLTGQLSDPNPELEGAAHDGYIAALEFIKGGSHLLSASGDSTVKLWDFSKKELVATYKGHIKDCTGICAIPEQPNLFATSSTDKSCRLWDIREKAAVRKFTAKYSTNCCTFLPDAKGIAVGCDNASWEVYDIYASMQCGRGKVKKGRCESICASKSGRVLYMGWDNADAGFLMMADTYTPATQKKIMEKETGDKRSHTDLVKSIALSPDGSAILSASFDGNVNCYSMVGEGA